MCIRDRYVFNKDKMFKYLPSKVYNALIDAIDNGAPLDMCAKSSGCFNSSNVRFVVMIIGFILR